MATNSCTLIDMPTPHSADPRDRGYPGNPHCLCSGHRREFLWQMGAGFAGLALTSLLDQDGFFARHGLAAENAANPLAPHRPHHPAKARSVIFLFMYGGPSSMD